MCELHVKKSCNYPRLLYPHGMIILDTLSIFTFKSNEFHLFIYIHLFGFHYAQNVHYNTMLRLYVAKYRNEL